MATSEETMSYRLRWPDTAKGITILLVVILHATMWVGYLGAPSAILSSFNTIFSSMRMPLFFCVAGIFASKWMFTDWRTLVTSKLALLLWVFLAWQPVFFAFKYMTAVTLPEQDSSLLRHIMRMIASPIRPNGETWFLWALAVYFLLARLLKNLPPTFHLIGAAVASVAFGGIVRPLLGQETVRLMGAGLELVIPLYFFFTCGLILKPAILRATEAPTRKLLIPVFLTWMMFAGAAAATGISRAPGIEFVLQILGVAAGISLAVLFQRGEWLRRIGRNTLPIYTGHMIFVSLGVVMASGLGIKIDEEGPAIILSFAIAGSSAYASWMLWRGSLNNAFGYMYRLPPRFHRAATQAPKQF